MSRSLIIRDARAAEFASIGALLVAAYSQLEGFPRPTEQPRYYALLGQPGALAALPGVRVLVAVASEGLIGTVV